MIRTIDNSVQFVVIVAITIYEYTVKITQLSVCLLQPTGHEIQPTERKMDKKAVNGRLVLRTPK